MKKAIILEDDTLKAYKQYKKFKSILYKKRKIEYKGNNEKIKEIAKVLNIKSRMKRLEYIFDKSCEQIDNKFKEENICGFDCNQCIVQRKDKTKEINGCCRLCRFQGDNGCKSKNLTCKLFFCDDVKQKYDVPKLEDLKLVKLLTRRQRLMLKFDLFSSREEVLMDLYIGFATIAAFREICTLIKNSIFLMFRNKYERKANNFKIKNIVFLATIFLLLFFAIIHPIMPLVIVGIGLIEDILIKLNFRDGPKSSK